jgi:hypothetical protein
LISHGAAQFLDPSRTIDHEFAGKLWRFKVWIFAEHLEKADYLHKRMKSPLQALCDIPQDAPLDSKQRVEKYLAEMACGLLLVDRMDEAEFDDSKEGQAYHIWRALRDNHEEFGAVLNGKPGTYRVLDSSYMFGPEIGIQRGLEWMNACIQSKQDVLALGLILSGASEADISKNLSGLNQSRHAPEQAEPLTTEASSEADEITSAGKTSTE